MKRFLLAITVCIFLTASCDHKLDGVILLGNQQIDPSEFAYENRQPVFKQRERIYYILLTEEEMEDVKLRLQVLKLDMKAPFHGIEVAYSIDINRGQQKHYVTDYFVLHKAGNYVIRIFGHSDFEKPLAETEFLVEAL